MQCKRGRFIYVYAMHLCKAKDVERRTETGKTEMTKHKNGVKAIALAYVVLFLVIILFNSIDQTSDVLNLSHFPSTPKENEPFIIRANIKNTADETRKYSLTMYVDGDAVLTSESTFDALSTQTSTLTIASPPLGSAVRVYAEAVDLETGEIYKQALLMPQSPPEAWMSFASFSSLTTMLLSSSSSSSSSMSSSFTISYYKNAIGLSESTIRWSINIGLIASLTLVALLVFIELTNPAFGNLGQKMKGLRERYSLLTANLLIVFLGLVLTRVVIIMSG